MAGRVARLDGEGLQPLDVGPPTLDEERGRAIRPRLDRHGEEHVRGDPPLPLHHHHQRDEGDRDRDHVAARELGPDPRRVRERVRPLAREPVRKALVELGDAVEGEDDLGDEEAERDRGGRQEDVPRQKREEERDDRMPVADGRREPLGRPARPRLEERLPVALVLQIDRPGRRLHRCHIRLHLCSFPPVHEGAAGLRRRDPGAM